MKKEPYFNVNTEKLNDISNVSNKDFSSSFAENIVENFQQGAYSILEAKRLVESKDIAKDLNLILNDEEPTNSYKRINFDDKTSAKELIDDWIE